MNQYQTQSSPLLGIGQGSKAVKPSEVYGPGGTQPTSITDEVKECRFCGAHPHAGPEREKWSVEHHCWRCGYRESVNAGVSDFERRQQFDAFNKWLDSQTAQDFQHPTLNPPSGDEAEVQRMQDEIRDMQDKLAARQKPAGLAANKTQA